MPRGSFSHPFLWPVSEHQLRLYFPLVSLFSGVELDVFLNISVKASLKILTWFFDHGSSVLFKTINYHKSEKKIIRSLNLSPRYLPRKLKELIELFFI